MADEKHKTIKVKALQLHTYHGKEYQVGDVYEIDEQLVDSVAAQGKAERAEKPAPAPAKPSQPVTPMTSDDFPIGKAKK